MGTCKKYSAIAVVIRYQAMKSENKTYDLFNRNSANDQLDAFRHAYFNALMVKYIYTRISWKWHF